MRHKRWGSGEKVPFARRSDFSQLTPLLQNEIMNWPEILVSLATPVAILVSGSIAYYAYLHNRREVRKLRVGKQARLHQKYAAEGISMLGTDALYARPPILTRLKRTKKILL